MYKYIVYWFLSYYGVGTCWREKSTDEFGREIKPDYPCYYKIIELEQSKIFFDKDSMEIFVDKAKKEKGFYGQLSEFVDSVRVEKVFINNH